MFCRKAMLPFGSHQAPLYVWPYWSNRSHCFFSSKKKEAELPYRTSSSVRLWWELEEHKGPEGILSKDGEGLGRGDETRQPAGVNGVENVFSPVCGLRRVRGARGGPAQVLCLPVHGLLREKVHARAPPSRFLHLDLRGAVKKADARGVAAADARWQDGRHTSGAAGRGRPDRAWLRWSAPPTE